MTKDRARKTRRRDLLTSEIEEWFAEAIAPVGHKDHLRMPMPAMAHIEKVTRFLNMLAEADYPEPNMRDPMREARKYGGLFVTHAAKACREFGVMQRQVFDEGAASLFQGFIDEITDVETAMKKMLSRVGQRPEETWHRTAIAIAEFVRTAWTDGAEKKMGKGPDAILTIFVTRALEALDCSKTPSAVSDALRKRRGVKKGVQKN